MAERNIKLVIAYEGSKYHGWQRQVGQITIQQVLEEAVGRIVSHRVKIIGAGRTDSGVHALGQVCNFHTQSNIPLEGLRKGLNSLIPQDIHVLSAEDMGPGFHSRYSAKRKIYVYRILNCKEPDIFARRYEWHIPVPLDKSVMEECLSALLGTHDFSAFRSSGSANRNPVRTMYRAEMVQRADGHRLMLLFEADGFLRHMVRNIVGTVVAAGMGRLSVRDFQKVMRCQQRSGAGAKAPACGLFLVKVIY